MQWYVPTQPRATSQFFCAPAAFKHTEGLEGWLLGRNKRWLWHLRQRSYFRNGLISIPDFILGSK